MQGEQQEQPMQLHFAYSAAFAAVARRRSATRPSAYVLRRGHLILPVSKSGGADFSFDLSHLELFWSHFNGRRRMETMSGWLHMQGAAVRYVRRTRFLPPRLHIFNTHFLLLHYFQSGLVLRPLATRLPGPSISVSARL